MRRVLLLAAGLLISGGCIGWLAWKTDFGPVWNQLKTIGLTPWVVAIGLYLAGFLPRAVRWQYMLGPVGHVRLSVLLRSIVVGYAGNNVLPFRLGEVVRAVTFQRLSGIPSATGLASVAAERLIDGVTIVVVLGLSLAGATRSVSQLHALTHVFWGATFLVVGAVGGLGFALLCGDRLAKRAGLFSVKLGNLIGSFNHAIRFLRQPKRFGIVLLLSLLIWAIEGAMFVVVAQALGLHSPWLVGYLAFAVINLGILIPAAPGYVGVFQVASVLAFSVLGLSEEHGLAFGILVHSAQYVPITLVGLVLVIPLWSDLLHPYRAEKLKK